MKDWQGNTISAGDTIVVVRTKPFMNNIQMGYIINGKLTLVGEKIKVPEYCWDVIGEYDVVERNGVLYYRVGPDEKGFYWNLQLPWMGQSSDITCIKGKSDNEHDYYLDYFKVKTLS